MMNLNELNETGSQRIICERDEAHQIMDTLEGMLDKELYTWGLIERNEHLFVEIIKWGE